METKKIVLVGDANVGKTSFVKKLEGLAIPENRIATLGVEVDPIRRIFENQTKCFNIWDCAGEERYSGLGDGYYVESDGAIIMAECNNSTSITNIESWRTKLRRVIGDKPIVVVLNKCDFLSFEQLSSLQQSLPNVIFISCVTNMNIEEVLKRF